MTIDFENATPVDDPLVVLDLLYHEWATRSVRTLYHYTRGLARLDEPPHVEIGWYCGGYTKDLLSQSYRFEVTPAVVETLRARGWVKGTPHWGYTDKNEMSISESGVEAVWAAWEGAGGFGSFPRAEKWLQQRRWS